MLVWQFPTISPFLHPVTQAFTHKHTHLRFDCICIMNICENYKQKCKQTSFFCIRSFAHAHDRNERMSRAISIHFRFHTLWRIYLCFSYRKLAMQKLEFLHFSDQTTRNMFWNIDSFKSIIDLNRTAIFVELGRDFLKSLNTTRSK